MKTLCALAALILLFAIGATAETTNTLSNAEIQGRQLAQQLWNTQPAENVTNTGTLKIRLPKTSWREIPVVFSVTRLESGSLGWEATYEAVGTNREQLTITHVIGQPNRYRLIQSGQMRDLTGMEANVPFAGTDYSAADFGLEFFSWPHQTIIKKEFHNHVASILLESLNPDSGPGNYSRVISRIEEESGGVMEAQAFDAAGKPLKNFNVKSLKKVNGRWQVESIIMENVQTGSRTRLEFDLKP
jgi:hypothetical protein